MLNELLGGFANAPAATAAAAKSSNHTAINFNLCVYAARPSRYNKRDTIITSKF